MLTVKREKRTLAPAGVYPAKVASVEAEQHEQYGQRVAFAFDLLNHSQEDGFPTRVFKSCNMLFSPKASLTGVVESLIGRRLTTEEAEAGMDLEQLVGVCCQLVLEHQVSETTGSTYAKVANIVPASEDEVIEKDQEPTTAPASDEDDSLPF
jgi:hypothetical protein